MSEIKAGDLVRSHVSVMGKSVAMHIGIVTRNYGDGTCDVDRMSLHGGRPWIVREATSSLTLEPQPADAVPKDEGGWLPIESAPKDGTEVLLYHHGFKGAFYSRDEHPRWWVDRWRNGAWWQAAPSAQPTHWQHLPPAPKGKQP